jgi:sporulation protein YlmC with PRC-barrel domain
MKTLILASLAAVSMAAATSAAQSAEGTAASPAPMTTPASPTQSPSPEASADTSTKTVTFVARQSDDLIRGPKLVGVAVYDSSNKSVGKVHDVLLDEHGAAKVVVIATGGILGIGGKDIAVPYSDVSWRMSARTAEADPKPAGAMALNPSAGKPPSPAPTARTVDPKAAEAYQGYPDKAVINVTQAQIKSAPAFKYAPYPTAQGKSSARAIDDPPARSN